MSRTTLRVTALIAWALTAGASVAVAQQPAVSPATAPTSARAAANIDLTGYWVSYVTEDWRFRMVTPPLGDTASVPLNQAGIAAAAAWDIQKDLAAGEQCKPFGAGGIMNMPVRLRISWQDDTTLKMEIDNGTQTRLFNFARNAQPPAQPEWQGFTIANWETQADGQGQAGGGGRGGGNAPLSGGIKAVTTRMRPGYMRRNGVPYSANATLTEYFDVTTEPNGDRWLILTSSLDDPTYLNVPYFVTRHFKKEADASKFQPRACEMTPPVGGALTN